ncbi:MAG: TSUP family transporter, partial [Zoogloea sp.]|nr:TSUP family transporter [Zoogloea sp.]
MVVDGTLALLGLGAMAAGLVDAVVGGGGLIQVPMLLAVYPAQLPATLFGTNKLASIVGTASAAARYARRIPVPWAAAMPAALMALPAAWFGARMRGLGTGIVSGGIGVGLFLSGLAVLAILIKMAPYRLQRFLVFMNPYFDPKGAGYQVNQALIA